jgi:uncharacterized membrane protein
MGLFFTIQREFVAVEIVRFIIAAIGLVLAIVITSAVAAISFDKLSFLTKIQKDERRQITEKIKKPINGPKKRLDEFWK